MATNGPIGIISKKVASGIAFATEVREYNKAKKWARKYQDQNGAVAQESTAQDEAQYTYTSSTSLNERKNSEVSEFPIRGDNDERNWSLDEAQDELVEGSEPRRRSKGGAANPDKLIDGFLSRHPVQMKTAPSPSPQSEYDAAIAASLEETRKLRVPVVIPQRRPQSKKRGFIRAYAPDLAAVGIDQATWLDFIETFNEASLANPWINALNLASIATSALPSVIGITISIAVMAATKVAMDTQARYRQNKALDKLNDEFFRPRGLYCLIMTWDPSAANSHTTNVDLDGNIQNIETSQSKIPNRLKSSTGTATNLEFMETAELVFPGLDFLAAVPKEESQGLKNKIKRGKLFIEDYRDRKAQAQFACENPDHPLSKGIDPTFASIYSNPNHPIHSGSVYSLISLGRSNQSAYRNMRPRSRKTDVVRGDDIPKDGSSAGKLSGLRSLVTKTIGGHEKGNVQIPETPETYTQEERDVCDYDDERNGSDSNDARRSGSRNRSGGMGRLLQQKVFYLMVVNLPTEEQFAEAREVTRDWDMKS